MSEKALRVGVVMDPIASITPKKDSSLAMLLEAQPRGAEIHYLLQKDVKHVPCVARWTVTLLPVAQDDDARAGNT